MKPDAVGAVASRLMQAWDGASLAPLPSSSAGGFDLPAAWHVASELFDQRQARGEVVAGWKIGFTNRSIWERYGVHAPIWGPVWQGGLTLLDAPQASIRLAGLCQPRLEPEVVFGLRATPQPDMSLQALPGWQTVAEQIHQHGLAAAYTTPEVQPLFGRDHLCAPGERSQQAIEQAFTLGGTPRQASMSTWSPGWRTSPARYVR